MSQVRLGFHHGAIWVTTGVKCPIVPRDRMVFDQKMIFANGNEMKQVVELITKVAQSDCNVLIAGESGTGKEVAARTLHRLGARSKHPFVAINCAAIPESLFESELFGFQRGAFTGAIERKRGLIEEAEGGTLLLDEVGDMPLSIQAKLLRFIQERQITLLGSCNPKTVNVRVISASHYDLSTRVDRGQFRQDLYYRLAVVQITMPPLRDRKEDIVALVSHFLKHFGVLNRTIFQISHDALAYLLGQSWPGNIRELQNRIERAIAIRSSNTIQLADLFEEPRLRHSAEAGSNSGNPFQRLLCLKALEDEYIDYVLKQTEQQQSQAAQILGINRKTLYRRQAERSLAVASIQR